MQSRQGAIHVQEVRKFHKGKAFSNFYLRQSIREGKKVHKVTLGNLSSLPLETIQLIPRSLKDDALMAPSDVFEIVRTVPHGTTAALLNSRTCAPAQIGHPKGGPRGKRQIVFGLLCSREGCPVGVEVFQGNTGDPMLAGERERKRQDLIAATEKELDKIVAATGRARGRLRGKAAIGLKVGAVIGRHRSYRDGSPLGR